jgi:hypothetical protein
MNKVNIKYSAEYGEYRVPGPNNTEEQAYYTDDKQDAVDTAKVIYGKDVLLTINYKSISSQ